MAYQSPRTSPRKQSGNKSSQKSPVQDENDQTTSMFSKREAKERDRKEKLPPDLAGLNDYVSISTLISACMLDIYRALTMTLVDSRGLFGQRCFRFCLQST